MMSPERQRHSSAQANDELGRDMELASALELLDPGRGDPTYWMRFRAKVLRRAAPELARRRLMTEVSLPDVVMSWARAIVPAAVVAAALAGLLLLHDHTQVAQSGTVGVEELLVTGVQGSTIPAELDRTQVAFASESF